MTGLYCVLQILPTKSDANVSKVVPLSLSEQNPANSIFCPELSMFDAGHGDGGKQTMQTTIHLKIQEHSPQYIEYENKSVINVTSLPIMCAFWLQEYFVLLKLGAERRKTFKTISLHTRWYRIRTCIVSLFSNCSQSCRQDLIRMQENNQRRLLLFLCLRSPQDLRQSSTRTKHFHYHRLQDRNLALSHQNTTSCLINEKMRRVEQPWMIRL